MNEIPLFSQRPGRKTAAASSIVRAMAVVFAMSLLLSVLLYQIPIASGLSLNPSTPPGEIIERQLEALKNGDIGTVYKFASPGNKRQTGDVTNFARMVQSGPYRYLLGHSRSEILLESKMAESRQYLVRVTSSLASAPSSPLDLEVNDDDDDDEDDEERSLSKTVEQKKILEYWWSLSRCKSGEYTGSYMVDAVIPNQM